MPKFRVMYTQPHHETNQWVDIEAADDAAAARELHALVPRVRVLHVDALVGGDDRAPVKEPIADVEADEVVDVPEEGEVEVAEEEPPAAPKPAPTSSRVPPPSAKK